MSVRQLHLDSSEDKVPTRALKTNFRHKKLKHHCWFLTTTTATATTIARAARLATTTAGEATKAATLETTTS